MVSHVGPYVLTAPLREDFFGKLSAARNRDTGQQFAVRELGALADCPDSPAPAGVPREAAVLKTLDHPNLAKVHEVLFLESRLYLVTDPLEGRNLFDYVQSRPCRPEDGARALFQQVVDAVDYCHKRGVFHEGLNPEHVLIDGGYNVKITDFGLMALRRDAMALDSPYFPISQRKFSAPEVNDGPRAGYAPAKLDSWSCGLILNMLVSRRLPNERYSWRQVNGVAVCYVISFQPWMRNDLRSLLSQLLRRQAAARYDMEQVRAHPWFRGLAMETVAIEGVKDWNGDYLLQQFFSD